MFTIDLDESIQINCVNKSKLKKSQMFATIQIDKTFSGGTTLNRNIRKLRLFNFWKPTWNGLISSFFVKDYYPVHRWTTHLKFLHSHDNPISKTSAMSAFFCFNIKNRRVVKFLVGVTEHWPTYGIHILWAPIPPLSDFKTTTHCMSVPWWLAEIRKQYSDLQASEQWAHEHTSKRTKPNKQTTDEIRNLFFVSFFLLFLDCEVCLRSQRMSGECH